MERSNRETRDLQWFGYKDTFLALLHSPSTKLESFLHYTNKLPYGGENLTHQLHTKISLQRNHTFFTTISHLSSQLLHTNYLYYNLVHTYLLHTNNLHYNLLANHTIYIPNTTIYNQIFTTHYIKIYVNILDDALTTWMWRSQQVVILLLLKD